MSQQPVTFPCPEPHESGPHPSLLISIRIVLILSSILRLGLHSVSFPTSFPANILYAFILSPPCHRHRPPHPLWFDRPNNTCIWWSSLLCSFLQPTLNRLLFGASSFLSALFSNALSLWLPLNVGDRFLHQHKTRGKIIFTLHYCWILNGIVIFLNLFYAIDLS